MTHEESLSSKQSPKSNEITGTIVGGRRNKYELQAGVEGIDGAPAWVYYPIIKNEHKKQKIYRIGEIWRARCGPAEPSGGVTSFECGGKHLPVYVRAVTLIEPETYGRGIFEWVAPILRDLSA